MYQCLIRIKHNADMSVQCVDIESRPEQLGFWLSRQTNEIEPRKPGFDSAFLFTRYVQIKVPYVFFHTNECGWDIWIPEDEL